MRQQEPKMENKCIQYSSDCHSVSDKGSELAFQLNGLISFIVCLNRKPIHCCPKNLCALQKYHSSAFSRQCTIQEVGLTVEPYWERDDLNWWEVSPSAAALMTPLEWTDKVPQNYRWATCVKMLLFVHIVKMFQQQRYLNCKSWLVNKINEC